jgi:hypothetical protein
MTTDDNCLECNSKLIYWKKNDRVFFKCPKGCEEP